MKIGIINWKSRLKTTLKARIIVIGFIFAMVGWFLLGVLLFGRFFEDELLEIEELVQSDTFLWGFRAFILGAAVISVWKSQWLTRAWQQRKLRYSLYIVYGIGFIGWLSGIIDLIT